MNEQLWWYVARSSGLVAWGLLAGSVVVGLALSSRALGKRPAPAWLLDTHRGVGGLSVVFTAVHVAALVADSYVEFGPVDLLVPMASDWRPGAVAWGVVAMYLLVAVEITSLLRAKLPNRYWRRTHVLSFPLAVMATVHLFQAGTDLPDRWVLVPVAAAVLAAGVLTLVRIWVLHERTRARLAKAARRAATPTPS